MTHPLRGQLSRGLTRTAAAAMGAAAIGALTIAPAHAGDYPPAPEQCSIATSMDTPGAPVTVTGVGFTPGETVTVGGSGSAVITTTSTKAGPDGSVSVGEQLGQPGPAQFTLSGTATSATCTATSVAPTPNPTPTTPPPTTPPTTAPPTTPPTTTPPTNQATTPPATTTTPPGGGGSVQVKDLKITRPKTPVKTVVQPAGKLAYTGASNVVLGVEIGTGLVIAGAGAVLLSRRRRAA